MSVSIRTGHVIEVLAGLEPKSVQVVCTSPPFWALRRYGTEPQVWDAAPGCEHAWGDEITKHLRGKAGEHAMCGNTVKMVAPRQAEQGQFCQRCGCWRGELGSEPTPELFLAHLLTVFDAVWRVLRDDGTLWVNLGDTYAANRTYQVPDGKWVDVGNDKAMQVPAGLKEKDLCGIPWRFMLAMQERGWYCRSVIVWAKTSAMPESVRDRPTSAWEPVFLFAKSARYFYDAESVRQPVAESSIARARQNGWHPVHNTDRQRNYPGAAQTLAPDPERMAPDGGANLRNVWLLGPEPLREEHYAAFPTELVRRCLRAGTSAYGACARCGAAWARVINLANSYNHTDGQPLPVPEVRSEVIAGGVRVGSSEAGWPPASVPGMRQAPPTRGMEEQAGTGAPSPRSLSQREPREGQGGETALPAIGTGETKGESVVEAVHRDTTRPRGEARERASEPDHRQGEAIVADTLLPSESKASGGGGHIHSAGLGGDPSEPEAQVFLLPEALHREASSDHRSRNPNHQGREACTGQHRGGVSAVQQPQAQPNGAAGLTPKGAAREEQGLRTPERMGHGPGWRKQQSVSRPVSGGEWRPTCTCGPDAGVRPCRILDPFVGSGTSLLVAEELGLDGIGIDLNPQYVKMATRRNTTGYTQVTQEANGAVSLQQRDLFSYLQEAEQEQEVMRGD